MSDPDILFETRNGWGVATLNRPKAFNAITREMCQTLLDQLKVWAEDDAIAGVILKSDHEKAFCAGGDIRWLHDQSKEDPAEAATMFRVEYKLNSYIHHFKKPYISFINGICMGGGVGISISSDRTIAGERALWAMPETGIGMIPDVGGSYFLARMADGFGLFLGLTGERLKGADLVSAGVATDFVPGDQHGSLMEALVATGAGATLEDVDGVIAEFREPVVETLEDQKKTAHEHFAHAGNVEAVLALLEAGEEAELIARLTAMSPTSLKLTKALIDHGRTASFDDCLKMEFRVVRRLMNGPDFHEGVRAVILDKDNQPQWQPASLDETDDEMIEGYLAPLEEPELAL